MCKDENDVFQGEEEPKTFPQEETTAEPWDTEPPEAEPPQAEPQEFGERETPAREAETPVPTVEEPVYPREPERIIGQEGQPQPVSPPSEQPAYGQPPYGQPIYYGQPPYSQPPYGQPPVYGPQTGYQQPNVGQQPMVGQQPPCGQPYGQPWQPPQYAPQWQQPVYPYAQAPYGQPPQGKPPRKKMSRGLKVFIWIASILAAAAILGLAGYLIHSAVTGKPENGQGNGFGLEEREDDRGCGSDFDFRIPDDGDGEETPDFDDGVSKPDADEPLPDIDVTPNNEGITIEPIPSGAEMTAQEVYEKVVKSTVTVAVTLERDGEEGDSTGTGIIATSDGYIITNSHVVLNSKSSRVKITTCDGQEYDAVVVGTDRTTDLAVLKTNDHNFTPAEFGDAEKLVIGDSVIAIGNPGGAKFSGSMTGGYVSGLDRAVGQYSENGMTYIQTDAAINPGNSGGPLVNMYGQVVGINSSKIVSTGYEGMGFAIPVSKAQPIIDELLASGYIEGRVRLGVKGSDVSNTVYAYTGNVPDGFVIMEIDDDSAFVGTDAQEGDIITAIDGETVTGLTDISNLLLKYSPGDTVTITLYRMGGGEIDVEITLLEDKGETQK